MPEHPSKADFDQMGAALKELAIPAAQLHEALLKEGLRRALEYVSRE